jgi:hypothetical protein
MSESDETVGTVETVETVSDDGVSRFPSGKAISRPKKRLELEELYEWVDTVGKDRGGWEGGDFRARVFRRDPSQWHGYKTGGFLEDFSEPISREQIQERFGGGEFTVSIVGPRGSSPGLVNYAYSLPFRIGGDPNVSQLSKKNGGRNGGEMEEGEPGVVKTMTNKVVELVDKATRGGGVDSSSYLRIMQENMDRLMKGKEDEIRALREEMRGGGGGAALLSTVTQYGQANIQTLITANEAQLRVRDEQHRQELQSLRDQLERVTLDYNNRLERMRDEFRREKEEYQRYSDRDMKSREDLIKANAGAEKIMLEQRIVQLQSDLTVARSELGTVKHRLEEVGDPIKQASRLGEFHEAYESMFGRKDEDGGGGGISDMLPEDAPFWLKALAGVANTSFGEKVGEGLANAISQRVSAPPGGRPGPVRVAPSRRGPQGPAPMMSAPVVPRLPPNAPAPPMTPEEFAAPPISNVAANTPPAQLELDQRIWPVLRVELEKVVETGVPVPAFVTEANKVLDPTVRQILLGLTDDQILGNILNSAAPESVLRMTGGQTYIRHVIAALRG